jgi:hypothetical protein
LEECDKGTGASFTFVHGYDRGKLGIAIFSFVGEMPQQHPEESLMESDVRPVSLIAQSQPVKTPGGRQKNYQYRAVLFLLLWINLMWASLVMSNEQYQQRHSRKNH